MKTSTGDVAAPAEDLQITEVEVDKIRTRIRLRKPKEEKIEESSSDESVSGDEFEDQSDPEQLADIRDKSKSDSSSDSHNNY